MKSTGKRLSWNTILGIEILSGIGLLALLCALALHFGTAAIAKAKMTNVWSDFRLQRAELVEQLALNGEGFTVHNALSSSALAEATVVDDIEAALAFRRPTRVKTEVSEDAMHAQGKSKSSATGIDFATGLVDGARKRAEAAGKNFNVGIVDRSVVIGMELDSDKKPYVLAVTPAAIGQGVPGSLLWLCGQRQPPSGWYRLPGPTGTDLPQNLLFSVCR